METPILERASRALSTLLPPTPSLADPARHPRIADALSSLAARAIARLCTPAANAAKNTAPGPRDEQHGIGPAEDDNTPISKIDALRERIEALPTTGSRWTTEDAIRDQLKSSLLQELRAGREQLATLRIQHDALLQKARPLKEDLEALARRRTELDALLTQLSESLANTATRDPEPDRIAQLNEQLDTLCTALAQTSASEEKQKARIFPLLQKAERVDAESARVCEELHITLAARLEQANAHLKALLSHEEKHSLSRRSVIGKQIKHLQTDPTKEEELAVLQREDDGLLRHGIALRNAAQKIRGTPLLGKSKEDRILAVLAVLERPLV